MGGKVVEEHLETLKFTYGLKENHGIKAVEQILFHLCRNIASQIKSDNTKSICHGRITQMEEQNQDLPEKAHHSPHQEKSRSLWKGNKVFRPR